MHCCTCFTTRVYPNRRYRHRTVAQLVSSNVCMPVAIPLMLCGSDTLKLDKCNSASTWQGKVYFNRTDHHAFASPHKPYEM